MRVITYREALREAHAEELRRDADVLLLGEDLAGGDERAVITPDFLETFGPRRVRDAPPAEEALAGAAIGAALNGLRPILAFRTAAQSLLAVSLLINSATRLRYLSGGQASLPLVVRLPVGGGGQRGPQLSQMLESLFAHIPGLKVALPATPHDAKGLLKAAVRDPDPVILLEHELLYNIRGLVPDPASDYIVPLGRGEVRRVGEQVTIISFSRMLHLSLQAAEELARSGIEAEVIDLRSVRPLDLELLLTSVRKTRRAVIVEEGWKYYGTGQGVAALLYEHAFADLAAPIQHIASADVPLPYAKSLERLALPSKARIVAAARAVLPAAAVS